MYMLLLLLALHQAQAMLLPDAHDAVGGDAALAYSSFLGGGSTEIDYSVARGRDGSFYVTGKTRSINYPATATFHAGVPMYPVSAVHCAERADFDGFVTRLDPTGTHIIFSAVFGGSGDEIPWEVVVDDAGAAYVAGSTRSADFPVTPGGFAQQAAGGDDVFVLKLSADGHALEYATYLGGVGEDYALGLGLGPSGDVYVTGGTASADFPTTSGAFDRTFRGDHDAFVTRLDATGSTLLASTLLGGASFDDGWEVTSDAAGRVFVGGRSSSPDFPTTPGAFGTSWQGSFDAFAVELDAHLRSLVYANLFGGPRRDECHGLAVSDAGEVVLTGVATSLEFPVTPQAYDSSQNGGYDVFVSRLSAAGDQLLASTFIGGSEHDVAWDIALDDLGDACVVGVTHSPDFPATPGCYQRTFGGLSDAFVARVSAPGDKLHYASFLGKGSLEEARGVAIDGAGLAWLGGFTYSRFFPTTEDAFDARWNGHEDAFVSVLGLHSSCPAGSLAYGDGWPGTNGVPEIALAQPPVLCEANGLLVSNSSQQATQGILFIGFDPTNRGTPWQGSLLVVPFLIESFPLAAGGTTIPLSFPCDESLCGQALYLQAVQFDPGASRGVAFSPGLEIDLGGW